MSSGYKYFHWTCMMVSEGVPPKKEACFLAIFIQWDFNRPPISLTWGGLYVMVIIHDRKDEKLFVQWGHSLDLFGFGEFHRGPKC